MSEFDDQEGTALPATIPKELPLPLAVAKQEAMTPQQARVVEVTEALKPAYEKASTLELTDAEVEALMAPFPDSTVDIRPHDGLIYLSHIHISNRLNRVFKPGKWALVRRWEKFDGGIMYAEYVLLIRGCYVGEAIGGHAYQPNNPKTNYSDALESTAGEALRRIAGKRLSCGSQVWEGDYAKDWVAKHAYQQAGKWYKRRPSVPTTGGELKAQPAASAPAVPANATKADLLVAVRKHLPKGMEEWLVGFLRVETDKDGVTWLMPNEVLDDLSESRLAILAKSPTKMLGKLQTWVDAQQGGQAETTPEPEGQTETGKIEKVSVKTGTNKKGNPWTLYGIKIGERWFNTFDTDVGEAARASEGSEATIGFEQDDRGFKCLWIEIDGQRTPEA